LDRNKNNGRFIFSLLKIVLTFSFLLAIPVEKVKKVFRKVCYNTLFVARTKKIAAIYRSFFSKK